MMRDRSYRRARERKAKKRAERLYLIWRCDAGQSPSSEEKFRKKWVGLMPNCHCTPCSCFMCGNARRIWNTPTLAERRSAQSMREILKDYAVRAA